MDDKLTSDELYQLRNLLTKLQAEPGLRSWVPDAVGQVYALTSVLLDDRRMEVTR